MSCLAVIIRRQLFWDDGTNGGKNHVLPIHKRPLMAIDGKHLALPRRPALKLSCLRQIGK